MSDQEMTEEVVEQIVEAAPEFVATMGRIKVQFALLGAACGTAAGAMVAWAIAYRKAEQKYMSIADDEVAEMREHYRAKGMALEAQQGKGELGELVKEKGYVATESEPEKTVNPPMAVQPPAKILEAEDEAAGEPDDSEMGEDAVEGPDGVKDVVGDHRKEVAKQVERNVFRDREVIVPHEWDWRVEKRNRTPNRPYVVHYEEKHDALEAGYSDISLTYYGADDVLCDERDEVMDPADRDNTVGEINLDRFGHGSNDPNIVFVRNDNLEILYEIVKSPNSFATEVHGLSHEAWDRGNLQRMRSRERDVER